MKKSIRRQIVGVFMGFLLTSMILIILFNVGFMERYYLENKKDILIEGYNDIVHGMENVDESEMFKFASANNLAVVMADWNRKPTQIMYLNLREEDARDLATRLFGYTYHLEQEGDKILEKNDSYTIQLNRDNSVQMDFLEIWGNTYPGVAVILRTPMESIQESINLSNKFYMSIGLIITFIGTVFISFFGRKLTNPIIELTQISQRMANLDFDAKYTSGGNDEIGILGHNFNQMSRTLEKTISELKSANVQLQKDIEQKEQIDEMRKEFLSNVSHELKTPIALIQGYAEGLADNISDDPESREFYCDVIIDESNKMNQMVKKLLTLNQLEFGNDQVSMERFDIVSVIRGVISSYQLMAEQSGVQIIFHQTEPINVWGDEFKVEEVLTNYISNAFNHIKNEKKIDIRCVPEEGRVRIVVFNTGDQIPEEEIDKIWIKFYKVDKARTREYGGNGIGLSIVKAIMESMNQECGAKNYDNGVAFWFTLDADSDHTKGDLL